MFFILANSTTGIWVHTNDDETTANRTYKNKPDEVQKTSSGFER
ncbi:MAG: hypothetical protein ACOYN4_07955 [Bacteroidales bacterium]